MNEFRMSPYVEVDGVPSYKDSEILELYRRVVAEGCAHVFRDRSITGEGAFLRMAKAPHTAFYVAYVRGETAGCVWLNRFQARFAQANFFTFSQFWGQDALDLGRHCLRELITMRGDDGAFILDMLVGITPADNPLAVAFALKCGWKRRGLLPFGAYDAEAGASLPAVLTTVTREDV